MIGGKYAIQFLPRCVLYALIGEPQKVFGWLMWLALLALAAVLAAAGHREHGAPGGIAVIRGLMLGQISFLGFYTVVWSQLDSLGIAPTYLLALAAAGLIGLAVARGLRRPAMR